MWGKLWIFALVGILFGISIKKVDSCRMCKRVPCIRGTVAGYNDAGAIDVNRITRVHSNLNHNGLSKIQIDRNSGFDNIQNTGNRGQESDFIDMASHSASGIMSAGGSIAGDGNAQTHTLYVSSVLYSFEL